MFRRSIILSISLAFALVPDVALAQEPDPVEVAAGCAPGSRQSCQCPNGAWSTQACDPAGFFTLCACGTGTFDIPGFTPPNIDFNRPKPQRRKRSSGMGMLIGGLITLGLGTTSLAIGITLIREDTVVPLGIVLTATGGTAMAVGIPLSIVGIVNVANNDDRGYYNGEAPHPADVPVISLAPRGLGFTF